MTKSKRTHPLDRDGDGAPGGSLPGNETAPMTGAEQQAPTGVEASALTPGSSVLRHNDGRTGTFVETEDDGRLRVQSLKGKGFWTFAPEDCELVDASGEVAPDAWARDNELIQMKLEEAGVRDHAEAVIDLANVTQWPDEDARAAEAFADAMMAEGKYTDDDGIERNADGSAIELPEILHERTVISGAGMGGLTGEGGEDDTFTAEEIAAGRTPVVEQEGEATTTAADQATTLDAADPLATVQTETAPIAVRLSELQVLTSARRLYQTRDGYSATWNAPFIDAATVDGWVKAGLAEAIPSAGNTGGVRATAEGHRVERQLRREQAQAEAA